jgi:hypothetical protein
MLRHRFVQKRAGRAEHGQLLFGSDTSCLDKTKADERIEDHRRWQMGKKATREQIGRIVAMLVSGQIPHDEAQEMIVRPRPSGVKDLERVAFVEEMSPGHGLAFWELYRPFYDWEPCLKPARADLQERVEEAIFWREIPGIVYLPGEVMLRVLPGLIGEKLKQSLPDREWDEHWRYLCEEFTNYDQSASSAANECFDALTESLRPIWKKLEYLDSFGIEEDVLWSPLYYATLFTFVGASGIAARFKPLLDLWLTGNFPIGFNKEGKLIVLVA